MLAINLNLKNGINLVVLVLFICPRKNHPMLRFGPKISKEDKIRYAKTYISGEGLWSPKTDEKGNYFGE
jgi:hypothetical protein